MDDDTRAILDMCYESMAWDAERKRKADYLKDFKVLSENRNLSLLYDSRKWINDLFDSLHRRFRQNPWLPEKELTTSEWRVAEIIGSYQVERELENVIAAFERLKKAMTEENKYR